MSTIDESFGIFGSEHYATGTYSVSERHTLGIVVVVVV